MWAGGRPAAPGGGGSVQTVARSILPLQLLKQRQNTSPGAVTMHEPWPSDMKYCTT